MGLAAVEGDGHRIGGFIQTDIRQADLNIAKQVQGCQLGRGGFCLILIGCIGCRCFQHPRAGGVTGDLPP